MNAEALIKNPWFKKIFEMKYLDLFKYFYNDEKPLKELIIFGKKIILSEKTEKKNKKTKERIIYFFKIVYGLFI